MSNADLLATSPDYLTAYSLTCEPFADELDDRFFYGGSALMQRLDLLTHLTQFGDSVILVSGPRGSGKSTLLGRFAGQVSKQWRLCLLNADGFEHFPQRLGDALGISDSDDELQLLERWASQTEASQLVVIVIDDSQQLPDYAVAKLCTLLSSPLAERIRLILFGTPQAQQALKQSFDQQEPPCATQLLDLPRLSEEETASYLMYRLAVAGYSGESPFTATEVRALCKAADGRPADINRLAHEALLEHQARARSKRLPSRKKARKDAKLIWGLSSLLVVGIATYLAWQRLQPTPAPGSGLADRRAQPVEEIPLSLPKPAEQQAPTVTGDDLIKPVPRAPATDILTSAETPPPAAAVQPADTEPVADQRTQETVTPPAPPVIQPPPAIAALESPPTTEPVPEKPTLAAIPTPPASAEPAPEDTGSAAEAATAATGQPHREDWLLQQAEQNYSLQLLGSRQAAAITDYIKQHRLDMGKSAYYRGSYRGGEWYVLLYGIYPDRQAALDARAGLPAKVKKNKPWPRTLKSVQAAIRETQ